MHGEHAKRVAYFEERLRLIRWKMTNVVFDSGWLLGAVAVVW